MTLEIEVHDDEWLDWAWLPESAYHCRDSQISIHWSRLCIHDPVWITFVRLRYPWIDSLDAA